MKWTGCAKTNDVICAPNGAFSRCGECSSFEHLWNASIAIQELWPPVLADSGKDPNKRSLFRRQRRSTRVSMIGYENMKPKRMQKLSFLMKTIWNQPTRAF
ncbi:hypothetical protein M514_12682 [Trichuris suis]|uniref:Uncharacterized protein n=1 Tax=Trichuris suis TaxID=68888 RepID=A0A085NMK2_9BILA|nr:hypothetical protein M514_12682 [Trichuris suis]